MPGLLDYLSEKYQTQNIKEINERLVELSSLFEISQIINSSLELNKILNNILLIPMGRLMISRGVFLLKKEGRYIPQLWKGISSNVSDKNFIINSLSYKTHFSIDEIAQSSELNPLYQFMLQQKLSLAIPLYSHEKLVGLALYGNKLNKEPFKPDEINFLNSLANISATTVENALKIEEIRNITQILDQRVQQLSTLFDIAQGLSATLEAQKIEKLLSYAIMGQMLVNRYAIVLCKNKSVSKIDCKGFLQDSIESLSADLSRFSGIETAGLVQNISDKELKALLLNLGACVLIPMRHQSKMSGFILLGEKINKQKYTEADLEFLTTLVSQAVISLENARLFQETLEKQRLEQELQVAKTIQKKLLPREIARIEGYDVWGTNISSKEVGGDYFDVIPISENRFVLAIGDVSGKSVPASLLMANLQAGLRTIISEDIELNHVVGKLNNLIYQNTDMDKYITFFVGILDISTNKFIYVNAGHNPPILINKNKQINLLDVGGIILGMMPDFSYKSGKIEFNPNDLLVCYTDGVNEAMNPEDEEFGEERFENLIKSNNNLNARELSEVVVNSLNDFAAGASQADDITMLIIKRLNIDY